jgi:hypothetical protein
MTHVLEIDADAQQLIQQIDFAEGAFLGAPLTGELPGMRDALVETTTKLGHRYPALRASATQYWRDEDEPTEDDGHDSLDLAIIRVLLAGSMLGEAGSLRRLTHTLEMFQDALAELKTWCPGWNFSQGVWA